MPQTGTVFTQRDSGLEIAAGRVPGKQSFLAAGANPSVGTSTETIWDLGGVYTYLTEATTLNLSSTSTDDAAAGDGCRMVVVEGLDGDWQFASCTAILNGQASVALSCDFIRIHQVTVLTAGVDGTSSGTIYLGTGANASGVPTNKYAGILAGNNQTGMAMFTIPAGHKGYVYRGYGSAGVGKDGDIDFMVRPFIPDAVFARKQGQLIYQNFIDFVPPLPYEVPAKADIEMRGVTVAGDVKIAAGFDLVTVEDL